MKKTQPQPETGGRTAPAETSLRDVEAKYRQILDSIDDGYYEVDIAGNFTFFNDVLPKFLGYTPEELMGANYRILMDDINSARVFQAYNQVYRTGVPSRLVEWEITTKTGVRIYVQSSVFLIRDPQGNPVGFRGLTRDITEKKRAEERLLESEEKYRALVESLNDIICTLDAQGCFSYVSPSVERIAGYRAEEVTGKPLSHFVPPEDIPSLYEWLEQAREEGFKTGELRISTKEGRIIHMRASFRSLRNGRATQAGIAGILTDVTEQKLLQEELRALAITDQMTGLYNRRGFTALAEQHLKSASRTRMNMILFFCDLDYMKIINDALGHLYGDQALIDTASILKKTFRESDIVARIGGDEFAILSINTTDISPEFLMARLQNQLNLHNAEGSRSFQLHISIGFASFNPDNPSTLDDLMTEADTAMYAQKKLKRI